MRKLHLSREPLAALSDDDLAAVAGGLITHGCTLYPTYFDLDTCVNIDRTPIYSVDDPCTT